MNRFPLVLIPCKSLAFGKSRLSALLGDSERESFCRDLLINTLQLAVAAAGNASVRLVSTDAVAEQIAKGMGIECYTKERPDLNSALSGVRDEIVAKAYWSEIVILPIDLPLATKAAIQSVIADQTDVTIVPDRKERGTNVLVLRGKAFAEFEFAYGKASFKKHRDSTASQSWNLSIRRMPELSFDVDEPADYLEWKKLQTYSAQMERANDR